MGYWDLFLHLSRQLGGEEARADVEAGLRPGEGGEGRGVVTPLQGLGSLQQEELQVGARTG